MRQALLVPLFLRYRYNEGMNDKCEEKKITKAKENKKGFIILGVFGGVIALLITIAVVGAFAPEIAGSKKTNAALAWTNTNPGFYDANKNLLKREDATLAGSFSLEQKRDSDEKAFYAIKGIETPENAKYLVMPSFSSDTEIKEISNQENQNIFAKSQYSDSLNEIYFKSFYFRIGNNAFRSMNSLTKISFASTTSTRQTLGAYSLAENTSLKGISFSSTLQKIEEAAFSGDSALETLDFGSTLLSSIGKKAFEGTSKLSKMVLPTSVTLIDEYAFKGSALTILEYQGTKEQFKNIGKKENAFEGSSLSSVLCSDGPIDL